QDVLGIVAEEKAPPLVVVVPKSAAQVLLEQMQKTQDPEEKEKLVRSAMELIGKQSEKIVQMIQKDQSQIQERKDSVDEADTVFKLAAAAAEAKFTSNIAATVASSQDALATGVVLTFRLAEIGKVREFAKAKREELAAHQATLADHPTDEKLKAK